MSDGRAAPRVGDRVLFEGRSVTVGGFSGTRVRLVDDAGGAQVLLLAHLLAAPGFELLEAGALPARLDPVGLLDALPAGVLEQARSWERHVVEVQTGLPPDPPVGARLREPYDPARHNLAERDAAKAAELTAAGQATTAITVKRMRLRYRDQGLWGLADHRVTRPASAYGRVDDRVVRAVAAAMDAETSQSTGTRSRLYRRVVQLLAAEHGEGVVAMPSRATFYRLVAAMDASRHTPSGRRPPAARRRTGQLARSPAPRRCGRASWCRPTRPRWTSWRYSTTALRAGWNWPRCWTCAPTPSGWGGSAVQEAEDV